MMKLKLFEYNAKIYASMSTTSSHQIIKTESGGGLGLVVHKDISTKLLEEGAKTSFQYEKWSILCKNRVLKIAAIYHSPYSARNSVTENIFIDKLTDWLTDTLASDKHVLVMNVFNIHINKDNNEIENIFLNSMMVMGLQCSYSFPKTLRRKLVGPYFC